MLKVTGLSSPVLRSDNDRNVRIQILKISGLSSSVFRFDNVRRASILKVKVCLDSLLQCLDLIMTEGRGFKC